MRWNALYSHGEYGGRRPTIISCWTQFPTLKCRYGSFHITSNRPGIKVFTCPLDYTQRHQIRKYHADEPKDELWSEARRLWPGRDGLKWKRNRWVQGRHSWLCRAGNLRGRILWYTFGYMVARVSVIRDVDSFFAISSSKEIKSWAWKPSKTIKG